MKILYESLDEFRLNEGVKKFLKGKGILKKNALDKHHDKFEADLTNFFRSKVMSITTGRKVENWQTLVNITKFVAQWIGENTIKGKDAYEVKDTSRSGQNIIEINKKYKSKRIIIEPTQSGKLDVYIGYGTKDNAKEFNYKDRNKLFDMAKYLYKLIDVQLD